MIDGVEKARCKKCLKFYNPTSNTTLRTHKSGCSAVSQNDTSQSTIGADGQVFIFDNDAVRLDFTKFVIQQALPFNHFNNVKLIEIIKRSLQPRYQHVSRTTLRSDAFKSWETAKKDIIYGFRDYKYGVSITTDTWTAPHGTKEVYKLWHFLLGAKKGKSYFQFYYAYGFVTITVLASSVLPNRPFLLAGELYGQEGPILEDVEETIAREEVDLGISPPNTVLMKRLSLRRLRY
ncbi:hypothetical protein Tco_0117205 [Tanacetum coccineum]